MVLGVLCPDLRITRLCLILLPMNRLRKYCYWPALPLLCCLPAFAATVYKSVDENGAVTFSDTLPAGDVLVETVVIEEQAPPSADTSQQRLEDMRETTDRMVADRMAREKHRAQMRELNAQRNIPPTPQASDTYYDTPFVYTGYTGNNVYPPRRHWRNPHQPIHPIVPPLRPHPRYQPDFDYPAKLIRQGYDPKVRAALR